MADAIINVPLPKVADPTNIPAIVVQVDAAWEIADRQAAEAKKNGLIPKQRSEADQGGNALGMIAAAVMKASGAKGDSLPDALQASTYMQAKANPNITTFTFNGVADPSGKMLNCTYSGNLAITPAGVVNGIAGEPGKGVLDSHAATRLLPGTVSCAPKP